MFKHSALALALATAALLCAGKSFAQTGELGPPKVMIGDQFGFCASQSAFVPIDLTLTTTTVTTLIRNVDGTVLATDSQSNTSASTAFQQLNVCNPYAGRVGFKISDNESPEPQDRAFVEYLYLRGVRGVGNSISPSTLTSSSSTSIPGPIVGDFVTTIRRDTTVVATSSGASLSSELNRHAELFGFERTFLEGNASLGLRVPFFQQSGDGSFSTTDIGDISVVSKLVIMRNIETGSLLSGGLMVTAPTGPAIETVEGNIRSTLLQPYLGYRWQAGNFYLHGFSSCIFPTDSKDVILALNSLGAGYTLQRSTDGFLRSITPVAEIHLTTPLNHSGSAEPIVVPDILSLTTGVHFGLGERSLLTLAGTMPVTGPRPFDYGLMAYLNIRF